MFGWQVNIQARPTPTLFETPPGGSLEAAPESLFTFSFPLSLLRDPTFPVATLSDGLYDLGFSFVTSELRLATLAVGSYSTEFSATFSLVASELKTVIVPLGTYSTEISNTFSFPSSSLVVVAVPLGPYSREVSNTFSFPSSSLV